MSTFEGQNQNQISKKNFFALKIKDFWLKYGEKSILAIGIILIALVSFEAGFLRGQKDQKGSVIVNQAACAPCPKNEESKTSANSQDKTDTQKPSLEDKNCAFVASKNSNKYHLQTCQFAQKIKPENRICFSSKEEAGSRGYQGAKCCIK